MSRTTTICKEKPESETKRPPFSLSNSSELTSLSLFLRALRVLAIAPSRFRGFEFSVLSAARVLIWSPSECEPRARSWSEESRIGKGRKIGRKMKAGSAARLIVDALLQRFLPLARRRIETAQAQVWILSLLISPFEFRFFFFFFFFCAVDFCDVFS